jgi:murein DD-endopeptidase MepM/ murein hydrolase activator NlpD
MIGDGVTSQLTAINTLLEKIKGTMGGINTLQSNITGGLSSMTGGTQQLGGGARFSGNSNGQGPIGGTFSFFGNTAAAMAPGNPAVQTAAKVGNIVGNTLDAAMPSMQAVVGRDIGYYNAATMQGGVNRNSLRQATFSALNGGLTSAGSDAQVAAIMSSMNISTKSDQYLRTATAVGNAAKYLNMDNAAATVAIGGLNSGQTSSDIMKYMGIYTSNPNTGEALGMNDIFKQMAQRFTQGQPDATVEDVQNSLQRGFLGQSVRNMGLSADQQALFGQYMKNYVQGKEMNLSDNAAMQKLMKGQDAVGNSNPANALYASNTATTGTMDAATNTFVKAMNDAVPAIEAFNKAMQSVVGGPLGYMTAFNSMIQSNPVSSAISTGLGQLGDVFMPGSSQLLPGILAGGGALTSTGGPNTTIRLGSTPARASSAAQSMGERNTTSSLPLTKAGVKMPSVTRSAGMAGQSMPQSVNRLASMRSASVSPPKNNGFMRAARMASGGEDTKNVSVTGVTYSSSSNSSAGGSGGGGFSLIMPAQGPISDGFGPREAPTAGASTNHPGIDIAAAGGSPVIAAADGTVTLAGPNGGLGNCVIIQHGDTGYVTKYGHMQDGSLTVSAGQSVKQGQQVGAVGSTGTSTGNHLHFQLEQNGTPIDPMPYLNGSSSSASSSSKTSSKKNSKQSSGSQATAGSSSGAGYLGFSQDLLGLIQSPPSGVNQFSFGDTEKDSSSTTPSNGDKTISGGTNSGGSSSPPVSSSNADDRRTSGSSGSNADDRRTHVGGPGPGERSIGAALLSKNSLNLIKSVGGVKLAGAPGAGGDSASIGSGDSASSGNNVVINLTVAQASESEARRMAKIIKEYIESDDKITSIGRR